jgi:hypothetical protein
VFSYALPFVRTDSWKSALFARASRASVTTVYGLNESLSHTLTLFYPLIRKVHGSQIPADEMWEQAGAMRSIYLEAFRKIYPRPIVSA